ncbi:MAG: hypothetical protein ACHREM_25580 [Polyangiales bacterium]
MANDESVQVLGRQLAWRSSTHGLAHRDLCARTTTPMDCGPRDEIYCRNWSLQSDGLHFEAKSKFQIWGAAHVGTFEQLVVTRHFGVTSDGRVYTTGIWENRAFPPVSSGTYFMENTGKRTAFQALEATSTFLVDGEDVYYVDGQRIMREGRDRKAFLVVDFKSGPHRAPIAKSGDTLFVAKGGDLDDWPSSPQGNVSFEAVRAGAVRPLHTTDAAYCFSANSHGAVVCRDQDLQFFSFDGSKPRRALGGPIVVPPKDADLTHATGVSLSADGGVAWFTKDDPKVIHVRTPPRSVLCGGPAVAKPEAGTVAR